ncbi:MAG: lipid-A-disaccharide synthase N-terminal domain-containing protein [Planctomycetota bacterium]|nr:lipid-A-disaccharide synthase N-terminal domain-containing protein [Planctomycetota bacterium]
MSEILAIYTFAMIHSMPFQNNYWLWKAIGWLGLGTFQARWIVQWLHSEKHKESRIPIAFWWLSLTGAAMELLYFLRQQDSVGIAGYFFSVVPYTRNLVLIYRKRRLEAEALAVDPIAPLEK